MRTRRIGAEHTFELEQIEQAKTNPNACDPVWLFHNRTEAWKLFFRERAKQSFRLHTSISSTLYQWQQFILEMLQGPIDPNRYIHVKRAAPIQACGRNSFIQFLKEKFNKEIMIFVYTPTSGLPFAEALYQWMVCYGSNFPKYYIIILPFYFGPVYAAKCHDICHVLKRRMIDALDLSIIIPEAHVLMFNDLDCNDSTRHPDSTRLTVSIAQDRTCRLLTPH